MTHGRKAKKAEQGDPRVLKAVTLRRDGLAIRAITRAMGVSRNTVRRLLRGHRTQRDEGAPALPPKTSPPRPSKLDEHMDTIRELLRRRAGSGGGRAEGSSRTRSTGVRWAPPRRAPLCTRSSRQWRVVVERDRARQLSNIRQTARSSNGT